MAISKIPWIPPVLADLHGVVVFGALKATTIPIHVDVKIKLIWYSQVLLFSYSTNKKGSVFSYFSFLVKV